MAETLKRFESNYSNDAGRNELQRLARVAAENPIKPVDQAEKQRTAQKQLRAAAASDRMKTPSAVKW